MTEAEWLACTEPDRAVQFLRGWASDRKLRLFGSACYQSLWSRFPVNEISWNILRARRIGLW